MINRKSLVTKHNPKLTSLEKHSPLSIGNGEFVFTADITGLQSFNEAYEDGMPLCTMSNWGWHTTPYSDEIYKIEKSQIKPKYYDTYGRQVPYYTSKEEKEIYDWVRQNPHKANLGRIGFVFSEEGNDWQATENINQELNLYTGVLSSKYTVLGENCDVLTCCDSENDLIAVNAKSELIATGKMYIKIAFPYPSHVKNGSDWNSVDKHSSKLTKVGNKYVIERIIDKENYKVTITSEQAIEVSEISKHEFTVKPSEQIGFLNVNFGFNCDEEIKNNDVFKRSENGWAKHWENGGMISFEKSTDERANELERRVILSQYLTAMQCGGSLPPAETGLTCNSWYGKFHLEMHYWHTAHFALFGRTEKLEKSLDWYIEILETTKKATEFQGYEGARWPKMVCGDGIDSPSPIGPLLIWQQPHPLLYCEWLYAAKPTADTLRKYKDVVEQTAIFMASYAYYDEKNDRYVLGPPVIPAQERHTAQTTLNPTFELEYWIYGLKTATWWLEKLGLDVPEKWADIINKIAMPTVNNGVYMAQENCMDTFERVNVDHPSMLAAYGMVGSHRIDKEVMNATLDRVLADWTYGTLWGWDFSIMAMTATRLGRPADAVNILLKETAKNMYVQNGHNRQVTRNDLPLYLPGNGGLLLAVAMMAAGYGEDYSGQRTPGFACDGWEVEFEDISPYCAETV